MAIGCGAKCAKIILIIFNFVFWLSGAALLGIGIWLLVDPSIGRFVEVIQLSAEDPYIKTGSYILIGIGAFIFIVGFFGCCGAIKESKCMLGLYIFFLVIVMAGELAAGILVAVFKGDIEKQLKQGMTDQVTKNYGRDNSTSFTKAYDALQFDLECCGVSGVKDYKDSTFSAKGPTVPVTCCKQKPTATATKPEADDPEKCQEEAKKIVDGEELKDPTNVHINGCYVAVIGWFSTYSTIMIGIGCGIAALEIFGFVFAVCLCRNIGEVDD